MDYTAIATLIGAVIVGYMSYRLGQQQMKQSTKSTELVDKTTSETEFRKSLLELIDSQEDKLIRQDTKIEKLDVQSEHSRNLANELKRANFNLALENERLVRVVGELETDIRRLKVEITTLQQKQIQQEAINDSLK